MNIDVTISIHALLAESDTSRAQEASSQTISIHALLAESDNADCNCQNVRPDFYPRSPCGERLPVCALRVTSNVHFYPRSPCGERRIKPIFREINSNFYPRSPCGERRATKGALPLWSGISIHALLAESDRRGLLANTSPGAFLSTLSLRRATISVCMCITWLTFLSTLSLRRATPETGARRPDAHISIHALLAESDPLDWYLMILDRKISIHALLAESDLIRPYANLANPDFYPRSPCGERPYVFAAGNKAGAISIHALLAESDLVLIFLLGTLLRFLSTLSLRRATDGLKVPASVSKISIHALLAESDRTRSAARATFTKFLSTLSLRRATP